MFYNCLKVVTSLQSTPDVALHRRVFGTCCYKESMHCSKSSPYTFLYANQKLSITRCQFFFTWPIEWIAVTEILEWDGTLDEFSMEISTHFPSFASNNLDVFGKELRRTALKIGKLCEWPSARERWKTGKYLQPWAWIGSRTKSYLPINNSIRWKAYEKIGANSGEILEKILEWDGTLDEFSMETSTHFPNFLSNNLDAIEKELLRIAHTHSPSKKHRDLMVLLDQTLRSDISGIQDVQSYSPVYNVTFQKYSAMTLNKLLDTYPLPRNSKGVEE